MGRTSSEVKNRFNRKTYDYMQIGMRKDSGRADAIRAAATAAGQSVSAYILQAINERMQRDGFQPSNADATAETPEDSDMQTLDPLSLRLCMCVSPFNS